MTLIVYHGGTNIIETPIAKIGRDNLDFGKGFYVTDIKEQARRWALSVSARRQEQAYISMYKLDKDSILKEARCKIFKSYDEEWLKFVVSNRLGEGVADEFDYIEGGVADDRVIDTVNLFISGLMGVEQALKRLAQYQPSNQICILNQNIIDKYLHYYGNESTTI